MKRFLYLIFCFTCLFSSRSSYAQHPTFSIAHDTIYYTVTGSSVVAYDTIYSLSASNPVTLKWRTIGSNFPADWVTCIGICDNHNCYTNSTLTSPPNQIWDGMNAYYGNIYSYPYPVKASGIPAHDSVIDLSMGCIGTTAGTYYLTVHVVDSANALSAGDITFIVSKWPTGVAPISRLEDEIMLYPNPAHNEVNIVYGAAAGVKTIAIYNLIGKAISVFRPLDNSSAQLATDNIPAGIYFIRLMDAQGGVIATRKFTKQ